MLKAEELRKGNLIMDIETGDIVEFVCLDIEVPTGRCYIKYLNGNNNQWDRGWPLVDVNPIPLTEGWLQKAGFTKVDYDFRSGIPTFIDGRCQFLVRVNNTHSVIYSYDETDGKEWYLAAFFYVHELQNIIHSLTNEELTINL